MARRGGEDARVDVWDSLYCASGTFDSFQKLFAALNAACGSPRAGVYHSLLLWADLIEFRWLFVVSERDLDCLNRAMFYRLG